VFADEGDEGLSGFLDGLVKRFGRGVAVLPKYLVLSEEHALDTAHKLSGTGSQRMGKGVAMSADSNTSTHNTTFPIEIRENLLLKSRLV